MGNEGEADQGVVAPAVFIVRVWRDATGHLTGVVERVATGEKAQFRGAEALAEHVQRMLARPAEPPTRKEPS